MTIDVELPFPTTHARRTDPQTSKDAAARVTTAASHRTSLLAAYAKAPEGLTAEEAADAAGIDRWAASKRVSDLLRNSHLYDTGERRAGESGREQRVLEITWAGVQLVRATPTPHGSTS